MSDEELSLADDLAGARAADRSTRIEWRDRIAEHGDAAIEAVLPWVEDPEYAAFAVRVIEATARFGEKETAIKALRSAFPIAPNDAIRRDIQQALADLGAPEAHVGSSKAGTPRRVPAAAGLDWPGFHETDFGRIAGTSWRRAHDPIGMVPLVLRPLQEIHPAFGGWAISRLPEVHIADRDLFRQIGEHKQGWRASKLVVYAHGPTHDRPDDSAHVVAGWYIEKGDHWAEDGPAGGRVWDWDAFIELLRSPARRSPLEQAADRHGLRFGDYIGGTFWPDGEVVGFVAVLEDGQLVIRAPDGSILGEGWDALADRLAGLPVDHWHCLHVWREWPAEEAIAMGQPFAVREVLPVLADLAPVYLDVIGPRPR